MALKKFIYPLDLRGDRESNRVEENHTLGTQQYRAFALKNGPFYTKDLAVRERNSGKLLKRGDDYECVFFYEDLTALTPGKEICGVIVVHNTAVSTDVTVSANIVGGPFAQSAQAIQDAIDALEINNKNTYWQNVIDKPDLFQPTPHMHDFGDIFGLEFLIDVLGHIRDTLMIGDNAQFEQVRARIDALESTLRTLHQEHLDDLNNPHQVSAEQVNCYDKERIDQIVQVLNVALGDLEPRFRSLVNGISDINDRIDGLVQALNNNNLQLNQNAQSLSRVHLNIADVNAAIETINDEINDINNEITGLKQRDQELQAAIDKNIQDINKEKTRNDGHDSKIAELEAKDAEHDAELQRQKTVDEQFATSMSQLTERVRLVEEKNTTQDQTLNTHASSIQSLQQEVNNLKTNKPAISWGGVQITGYVNGFDQVVDWTCPDGSVMVGAYSYHTNHTEDRRWRFRYRSIGIS
ncbi:minor tail protein [Vibrio phage pVa-21]|nr:minor tail protein [Vibrio phage pVa-21]